ncbi:MAG: lysine--tRNA ligase [Thermoactinomyces sp.]
MLSEQELIRREKLNKITQLGINPHPDHFDISHELKDAADLPDGTQGVRVAGRIVAIRKMGKLDFISIRDIEGKLQLLLKKDVVGDKSFKQFHEIIDIGDFIGVEGEMFTTKTGQKTLRIHSYKFLGKSLKPLPEKWHGIQDVELRYRQRYLDLIMTESSQKRFLLRSKMISEMRRFLDDRGFFEVETPVLTNKASGALAKPFITHHNSLDIDMFLRIAPETYLKRLIVGGFTKVYEFAKCFRNEGISPQHLQEFTMVEGYVAYWNYKQMMKFMRELILHTLDKVFQTTTVIIDGNEIDFSKEWKVVSFRDLILKDTGIDIDLYPSTKELYAEVKMKGIILDHENPELLGRGNFIDLLYKKVSRPKIVDPIFLVEHPIDLSPLARANDENPSLTDRFQIVVNGVEIVNAYSELVDAIEQRNRLEKQALLKARGDEEAMEMDEDYLLAMEHGMPPIAGWGFGVERLLMMFTNCDNIKDCVLFPITRPKIEE